MRICIDSCVFIQGLQESDPASSELLNLVGDDLVLIVPRLVAQEVTRNLGTPEQVRRFYQLCHDRDSADIVDEPVPRELVVKYSHLGLPEKADAFIGAFAEWQQVRYPVSDNRHFLRDLTTDAFEVLRPADLVSRWQTG
jgi:hypothetical protein